MHPPETDKSSLPREHLDRARAAIELGDTAAAVTWANLCGETAIVELAAAQGLDTRRGHFRRTGLARKLHEIGLLDEDLGDLLIRLNNERKHATYDGLTPDLRGRTWAEVLLQLELLVRTAEASATRGSRGGGR